jgi:hypothetical protein
MKNEIDKTHYCAAGHWIYDCKIGTLVCNKCSCYRRKWETPEQFKERTGERWSLQNAVYVWLENPNQKEGFYWVREYYGVYVGARPSEWNHKPIICASTEWGCPPNDFILDNE